MKKADTYVRPFPLYALAFILTLFMLNKISSYNGSRLADLVTQDIQVNFTDAGSYKSEDSVFSFAPLDNTNSKILFTGVSKAPVCYPIKGEITSVFAQRSDPFGSGESEFHTGYDIAADYGSDVYAYASGIVRKASYDSQSGYYIIIKHNDQLETFYAHCSVLEVKEGDAVSAGDIIAKAGSTGRSTGSHLHFEVRINGNAINPHLFLDLAAKNNIND